MLPRIRTLLLVAAIAGVIALLSPVAHADTADIDITRAEVQWDEAVVMGRGAAPNDYIYWEGGSEHVIRASKRGKFSFRGTVPSDCEGALSTGANPIPDHDPEITLVSLSNCTSSDPDDPPGADPELTFYGEQTEAHGGDAVRAVGFVADGVVISGGDDTFLRSWSWTEDTGSLNPEVVGMLNHPIYDLETSADVPIVVTGEGDWNGGPGSDTLRIWDANDFLIESEVITDPLVGTTAPIGFVYCVAISPYDPDINGVWTVASGFYGEIIAYETVYEPVYETATLTLSATKKTKKKRTKALAFSPDGATLASTSTAGRVQLWSFPDLILHPVTMSHGGSWVFPIAFGPYSESDNLTQITQIVSGSDGGTIKVWAIDLTGTPAVVSVMPVASGAVYSLDWWSTPPGVPAEVSISMIVAGGDGDITVYDADTMDILFRAVDAHTGRVNDVAFSPNGLMIVSGGADGELKLWDLSDP